MTEVMVQPWVWGVFVAGVVALLLVDLLLFQREAHTVSIKEAGVWVAVWVSLALAFGGVIWAWMGPGPAGEYVTGYIVEWALSVDNMFVFALIFSYFALPGEFQHRVLFYGILGALVFRIAFILAGAALLERFAWMIFVFGGFLVITGIRMAMHKGEEVHPENNPVLKLLRRAVRMTPGYHGKKFFIRENGALLATPLLAVLVAVETTDIIFAVDSIPAIFGVTRVPFIVFSSNAFAILGLRALFFVLAGMMNKFHYLKFGLSAILVFIGLKMIGHEVVHIETWVSLAVIAATLALAVVASIVKARGEPPPPPVSGQPPLGGG